jgi:hypothetical protein
LESILGAPTPPPPPNAGDIKPGVPGIDKATVRDRLEAHRNNAACASCHNKIDPLGFALENYDAIGHWRDQEGFGYNGRVRDDDPLINASGTLPDGQSFQNLNGLQKILIGRKEQFFECLTKKMMIYALGRALELTDRPMIEKIVDRLPEHNYTLRGIIKDIATSDAFLLKTREQQP